MSETDAMMIGRAVEMIREEMQALLTIGECARGNVDIHRLRDCWAPRLAQRIVSETFRGEPAAPICCGECD